MGLRLYETGKLIQIFQYDEAHLYLSIQRAWLCHSVLFSKVETELLKYGTLDTL